MDYGTMLGDALDYVKAALLDNYMRWLILIIGTIIFPILAGYGLRIYRGARTPPETDDLVGLFVDGIKLFIVQLIWAIPVIIVGVIFMGSSAALLMSGSDAAAAAGAGGLFVGGLIMFVVAIIIALFSTIAGVRFARTDSFGEAFNFRAILEHIGRIGWGPYVIALVILMVVIGVVNAVLGVIPILGWILTIILAPAFSIFASRYITQIYDSVTAPN
ncbi:hypothetical protein DSECCO2_270610 [anaerobic digester metagenome]